MYTLKTITKRNNAFLNHSKVRKSSEIQYFEMRRHILIKLSTLSKIQLVCFDL